MRNDSENDRHRSKSGRRHNEKRAPSDKTRDSHNNKDKKRKQSQDPKNIDQDSMNIDQFCDRHGIGRSTYYDLKKQGLGPVEMRIGRCVRISARSNRKWVVQREAETTARVPPLAAVKLNNDNGSEAADEQNEESEASDEIRLPKHRAKPKKTRGRRRRKHRHARAEHREVVRLDAVKPERSEESDEAAASKHGPRRDGKRGRHGRHHPDE